MAVDRVQRRIAAILAADVVGYSRLIGKDEETTLATLNGYLAVIDGLIATHTGRVFGSAGDSVIAEFASPVEAVRCATEIQLEINNRNAELPEANRMRFRIGINLGDVVVDGDNLMGDGVNVAARLEALAPPGGICVSEAIYTHVRDRLSLDFLDLGEHKVKNIARPVHAYRVPLASEEQVRSPFRGLAVFDFDHADIFFGRARAIATCTDRLERQAADGKAFLLIYGMSGSGKSSLLRAGLLPAITRPGAVAGITLWRRCLFRPSEGSDAIASLTAALLRDSALPELAHERTAAGLADLIRSAPDRALALIRAALGKATAGGLAPSQARLVLAVDQMEELFTTETNQASREAFVRLLATFAASGLVWVMGTIRADFFHRCGEVPGFSALKDGLSSYELLPPTGPEIAQIIREPARAAGLRFEETADQGQLEDVLQEAASADPESLPLLEFVLDALYEAGRDHRLLTFAAYRALGGLEGAIARRADEVVDALAPNVQDALPVVLRALSTVRLGDEAITASPALLNEAAGTRTQAVLVNALIAARLLVSGEDAEGHAIIRVAHESLLTRWPRARDIVNANRDFLETRARIQADARRWHSDHKNPDLLLPPGKRLAEAEELLLSRREEVDDRIVGYVEASSLARKAEAERERQAERVHIEADAAAAKRLARRTRIAAFVALTLALIAGAGALVGFNGQQEARREAARAEESATQAKQHADQARVAEQKALETLDQALVTQSRFLADLSREHFARGDYGTALALALEGLPDNTNNVDRPYVPQAEAALYEAVGSLREKLALRGHDDFVWSAAFSPDGTRILSASADRTARLWNAATGAEIAVLRGHDEFVSSAAFSPDGTHIVTASWDNTARLWDAATGAEIAVLSGHEDDVRSAAFSPDGTRIVTTSDDGTARLWHAARGTEIAVLSGHESAVRSAAFSPDGTRIVTASDDGTARLRDAASGTEIAVLSGHQNRYVMSAAFSPDGARIVTVSYDSTGRLWDAASGAEIAVLSGHQSAVRSAAFSPDGTRIVTAGDSTARLWDAASGIEIAVLSGHEGNVNSAAFSPDGTRVVTASWDKTARLWDVATGKVIAVLTGHEGGVYSAAFSPDGAQVVTASHDRTVWLWDAASGAEATILRGHARRVMSAAFSPDGARVVTASGDNTARLWDAADGAKIAVLSGHEDGATFASFSADGTRIVTASWDNTARLWDAVTEKVIAVLSGHENVVRSAAFSPDGARVVTASYDSTARLWDAASGTEIAVLSGHQGYVMSAAFSPDGTRVVTGSDDKTARLWDAASGAEIAVLRGHESYVSSAAFSADGTRILTASWDNTARLWDAASGTQIAVLSGHEEAVYSAVFSPDGTRVVTASGDKTARLWDAASGAEIAVLSGHQGYVMSAAFSLDGTRIVTASEDNTARIWRVFPTTQALVDYARSIMPRELTPEQRRKFFLE